MLEIRPALKMHFRLVRRIKVAIEVETGTPAIHLDLFGRLLQGV